ncbi:MAG: class I SAM-dependent methyltransferase [Chlorobium sp.]
MNKDLSQLCDPFDCSHLIKDNDYCYSMSGIKYPVIKSIPRFVANENYADDFGKQWNIYKKTQLDSYTGTTATFDRLSRCMNGHLENIKDKLVLEAGSGAGRFTEVLLAHGAIVHSFDYSNAVEANADNNGNSENLTLVQADIRYIPFPKLAYDYVICLGVLQHTPNTEESINHLWEMVRPGGYLVIDHYRFTWKKMFPPPIGGAQELYRYLMLLLPKKYRLSLITKIVNFFFPIHWKYRDSLFARRVLSRLSPVCFHYGGSFGLKDKQMIYEWALLDTHDGTTDFYRHLRTVKQIRAHLTKLGAIGLNVTEGGNGVEAFCHKSL